MTTTFQTARTKWEAIKPVAIALAVGLLAGPFISNMAGWQITSSTARAQLQDGLVEQLASICEGRARAEVMDPSALEFPARQALAKKWMLAPSAASAKPEESATSVNSEAEDVCARRLGA